jgi:hypothetical protein
MKEIAPFLHEFKMDDVRKPKHLQLIPDGVKYLQLNEEPEFEDYISTWTSLKGYEKIKIETLEINFSHWEFYDGVLSRIEPTKCLIIRESIKTGRFKIEAI